MRADARAERLIGIARAGHVGRGREPECLEEHQLKLIAAEGDHVVFSAVIRIAAAADEDIIEEIALEELRHADGDLLKAHNIGLFRIDLVQHESLAELPAVFGIVFVVAAQIKSNDLHICFLLS